MEKVKNFFKKMWSWIKTHWYVIPIVVVFIISLFMVQGTNSKLLRSLLERYRDQQDRHREEMAQMNKIHTDAADKQAEIDATYRKTIDKVRERHSMDVAALDEIREKDLKVILERTKDDPKKMAHEVNLFFGVPVYEEEQADDE